MKTGNIGIRNLADIGVADIDVYGTERKKSLFEFRGTVQFYRSLTHSNGNLGRKDTLYTGQFGFDLYNKDHSPEGSVIYYLDQEGRAIQDKEYKGYVSPYLSIWYPKADKEKSNVILYVKANDDSKIPELLEYECKEWNKDSKSFSIPSTKIQITKLNTENKGGNNYYKINIQCLEAFENDISIIAKHAGKNVGRIIVKANAKIYETTIQPVLVSFGDTASTNIQIMDHEKFVTDLVAFFNNQSFNQAYIRGKLADKTHAVTFLRRDFLKGDVVKEMPNEENACGSYKGGLFVNYTENSFANAYNYNDLIEERYSAYGTGNKERQQAKEKLEEAMVKLIKEFKHNFSYSDISDLNKAKNFYESHKATNAWNEVKVKEAYNNYKILKEKYKGNVYLDKNNKIYFFINKDVEGGRQPLSKAQAYSLPKSGVAHIFSSAYYDKDSTSLVVHELGHGFGLNHTFEDSILKKIEKNNQKIKELEDEKRELEKIKKNSLLKNYYSLDKKYLAIQKIIISFEKYGSPPISYFEKAFILNLVGNCSFYEDGNLISRKSTSVIEIENNTNPTSDISVENEINSKEGTINKLKEENSELNKKKGIIAKKSSTLENYMDYRQPDNATCEKMFNEKFQYKSYYQMQWSQILEIGVENGYIYELNKNKE